MTCKSFSRTLGVSVFLKLAIPSGQQDKSKVDMEQRPKIPRVWETRSCQGRLDHTREREAAPHFSRYLNFFDKSRLLYSSRIEYCLTLSSSRFPGNICPEENFTSTNGSRRPHTLNPNCWAQIRPTAKHGGVQIRPSLITAHVGPWPNRQSSGRTLNC